ncbi:MAG: iron-containing alcohol dehydrogenase [Treponema sp.]|nr:iron-containing alcohol dehydrogenase [Treponema sp.]
MDISFKFDPEVLIGENTLSMAGTIASRYGERIMVAADSRLDQQLIGRLKDVLEDSALSAIIFAGLDDGSSVDLADKIVELSNASHCDLIIGFGGEKTQTIARMAAIMAPSKTSVFDLLEGKNIPDKFLPFLAIPTEGLNAFSTTDFFLAADPRNKLIKLIQSPKGLYASIILDSSLLKILSGDNAAAFVLEGFFSAVEAYCSAKANFISDAVLERALNFYAKLLKAGADGMNAETFAQAGFLTALGSAASCPGVGAALSAAINARCPIPKPVCSTALFPALAERLAAARPEKMARVASYLGNAKAASTAEAAASAAEGIKRITTTLGLKTSLNEYNIPLDRLTAAAEAARGLDLTANSPWTVSEEEVFAILKQIL